MHNFTVAISNGDYVFRLQSSHHQMFMSEVYNFIVVDGSRYVNSHMKVEVIKVTGSKYVRWWTP